MAIVYACIAPHGGHLLLEENAPGPLLRCRRAMRAMRHSLAAACPDSIVVLTPHGIGVEGTVTLGLTPTGYGELDDLKIEVATDLSLAAAWSEEASSRGIPMTPLVAQHPGGALPLDWGVTIPLALLTESATPRPVVVACPARDVSREHLVALGETLADAARGLGRRIALIVSADQGHGHAADGPYGFTPLSADYDGAMQSVIEADDLPRLLAWPEDYAESALADSYWQTLSLIGVQKRVPLRSRLLAYEIDHYFGLLCAEFTSTSPDE